MGPPARRTVDHYRCDLRPGFRAAPGHRGRVGIPRGAVHAAGRPGGPGGGRGFDSLRASLRSVGPGHADHQALRGPDRPGPGFPGRCGITRWIPAGRADPDEAVTRGRPGGNWVRGWTTGPLRVMFRTAVDEPAGAFGVLGSRSLSPARASQTGTHLIPAGRLPGGLASPHEAPRRMRPAPRCPRRRAGRSTAHRSAWTRCRYAAAGGKAKRGSPVTLHRGVLPGLGRAGPQP